MKRFLSLLLAAALLATPLPAKAEEASETLTGDISATVRLDYPQELPVLGERKLQVELLKNGSTIAEMPLYESGSKTSNDCTASVTLRNSDGGELSGSRWPGYLDASFSGLPLGDYTLEFTGDGYVTFSQDVTLKDYSQHVILGTGDGTFTLGDVNDDGQVNSQDRELVSQALGSTSERDKTYDLDGDGNIDVTDLAYVSHNINASGGAEVKDTYALSVLPSVNVRAMLDKFSEKDLSTLFRADGESVSIPAAEGNATLEIPFISQQEISEIQIASPDETGKLLAGTVRIEGDNYDETVPFDLSPPEGVRAIGPVEGRSVITIPLGRRVAVKAITISVTRTEDNKIAVIESIQFLKDIVPENPAPANNQVTGLKAEAGDGRVSLSWNELPNVSGYRVDYALRDGGETRSLPVDVPRTEVSGLENEKTYRFTVTPVDGNWSGKPCDPVYAEPQTSKVPDAPESIAVTPLDSALQISWKVSKGAAFYEFFYQAAGDSGFTQWGEQLTNNSLNLTGLTNGTEYSFYVVAGNHIGRSRPSRTYVGTPVATDYSRPEGIPTEGVIDYNDIEDIRLADAGNVSSASFPAGSPFQPSYMADGKFETHWTSQSWDDGNFSRSKQVLCTFKTPQDLSSVIWVPRMDGGYRNNLRRYSITVWQDGDDLNGKGTLLIPDPERVSNTGSVTTWTNVCGNPGTSRFAILPVGPVENVKKIAITIDQWGYTAISLSELMFLRYDPEKCLPDNIAALFADDLRTSLKADVKQADIDELRARLNSDEKNYYLNLEALADELDLAEELLQNQNSGVILRGIQHRSSSEDSKNYQQGGSNLQPLGVAAKAGEEITIYASGIPDDQTISVTATQFNAEVTAWQAQAGTIRNGRNLITIPKIGSQNTPRGGSLYLTYGGPNPEDISLHVRRATAIPTLELSDWYDLDENARKERIGAYADALAAYVPAQGITDSNRTTHCLNVTEISTPTVLLSLPAAAVLSNIGPNTDARVETLYQDILAWEDVMHLCKTTQGIDKTYGDNDMTSRQNIRCMQMFAGAFMYAAGNHIGIGYGSCGGMVCGRPLTDETPALFGWGIAHEIGHNMDKLGKAEITNNIYSLVVQTADQGGFVKDSRLELSGKYPLIFTKTAQAYPGDSNDVFLQLGLYWQLHLAYDDASNPLDFYNRFFKAWKSGKYFGGATAYGDKLARTASGVSGYNLTEFFTRWGVVLSAETLEALKQYQTESRAIWYLSDQSRRDRLNSTQSASGSLTVSAGIAEGTDNKIKLTITPSISGKLQGYEIQRSSDGGNTFQSIDFTSETSYTDVIGSANHRTYTYRVAAYDILGYRVCESDSNQVRVAYDKTVPADAYSSITRSGDTITFTLKQKTTVSGLKIQNAPESGAFTVMIADTVINAPDAGDTNGNPPSGSVVMAGDTNSNPAGGSDVTAGDTNSNPAGGSDETAGNTDGNITGGSDETAGGDAADNPGGAVIARSGDFSKGDRAEDGSWLVYFQKPGAESSDTRIWTYDAMTVIVTGIPESVPDSAVQLISYAGDDVAFLEGGAVGRLFADYDCDKGGIIKAGTLVIVGTYRGNPAWQTVRIEGKFRNTVLGSDDPTEKEEIRPMAGTAYLFAEVPEDGAVSDISDGLFLFVPNVQQETELQGDISHCAPENLLPAQMRAVLSRTDTVDSADSQHVTAETLWINTPGGDDLPVIVLE